VIKEMDESRSKLNQTQIEKEDLQKKLTKQIQLHENETSIKYTDHFNRVKSLEENHAHVVFELRQLLNMQQRMGNKWKEECHSITNQTEIKFNEMKKNYDNLKLHSEQLSKELAEARRREVEVLFK
jgi:predicted nuclease with TOPRIM domain